MSRVLTLWNAGVGELIRGFAEEGAGKRAKPPREKKSPLSRAIARLQQEGIRYPGTDQPISYEDARNVYRRAVRSSQRAARMMDRYARGQDTTGPGRPPRPGARPPPMESHRVLVVFQTPSGVEYRGLVVVEPVPLGTPVGDILSRAVEAARGQTLYTARGVEKNTPKTGRPVRVEIISTDPYLS